MKKVVIPACLVLLAGFTFLFWTPIYKTIAQIDIFNELEPDLPSGVKIDKQEYRRLRNEHLSMLRGLDTAELDSRSNAILAMEESEQELAQYRQSENLPLASSWQAVGPAPIPNGQTVTRTDPVSGRVSSIAVHPTNPNIVYVGTAQGGLYRTLDGGTTWIPMLDAALSLAIGSVAIAPSDPTTVFVGTGEPAFSLDGFFGVGIYRITNADSANPIVAGPLSADSAGGDIFTGRSISEIQVHPTNANILFASTSTGVGGLGGNAPATAPPLGLYRTANALAGTPTFEKLAIQGTTNASRSVIDIAIEPGNAGTLLAAVIGGGGDGGIYRSINALDAVPAFTRSLITGDGSGLGRTELAINKIGATVTVVAATGTANGTVFKSTDGGVTFPTSINNSFCTPQCFYDIAVAIDPNDANKLYLGGSPALPFGRALDGSLNFVSSSVGLHVDTHAIAVAPSNTNTIYFGSDGGVWKSVDAGANWVSQNNSTLSSMQYQSIALHPTDRFFTIGGTQDNGTHFLRPNNTWVRATGGDGGQSVIDQNATDTTNVFGYHTFFNSTGSQIGFRRLNPFNPAGDIQTGVNKGCFNNISNNGIVCSDPVLFYAPISRGPGNPNTVYMGTNRVYRSADRGDSTTIVSQQFTARVSAVGIAPNDDNIRLAGTTGGQVFLSTTAGATTMTDITGAVSARYVTRFAIDPTNNNIAYVALGGFGLAPGSHIFKTTNLLSGAPTWTASATGIPDVPTNALAIDPANANTIFAGTDIGVFRSANGGASWQPFSDGLPRVAVFDMQLHPVHRILKIATHGRGIYENNLSTPVGRGFIDFDGDRKTDLSIFRPAPGEWWFNRSTNGTNGALQFGTSSDVLTPNDYTGDGKTDVAIFRPSTGSWFVLRSEDFSFYAFPFGSTGDVPAPADYDGDGKSDAAVFRPSTNTWFISRSSGGTSIIGFGIPGDRPVTADYDGDGKSDIAIFRPGVGEWWVQRSSNSGVFAVQFGTGSDKTVPGDFTGDGKADIAFYRPSAGTWTVLRSEDFSFFAFPFGAVGDIPSPGDYDGDGRFDAAVFRPSNSTWFAQRSTAGTLIQAFGVGGDVPLPSVFVR